MGVSEMGVDKIGSKQNGNKPFVSDLVGNPRQVFRHQGSNHTSFVVRKPVFGISNQVQHKPGCAATEDG